MACFRILLILLTVSLCACTSSGFVARQGDLVLPEVSLIVGDGSPTVDNQTIVLRDERIAWVGNAGILDVQEGAEVLPTEGSYAMPGLIDMHAHLTLGPVFMEEDDNGIPHIRSEYDERITLSLADTLLRYGVTTIRNPGGPAEESVNFRERLEQRSVRGPRMLTAGEGIGSIPPGLPNAVTTADAVRAEVDRQSRAGVDLIKLYQWLSPDLARAAIEAAHARGLPVIGHLMMTDWTTAAELGIDGIVHMLPASATLLPEENRAPFMRSISGTQMMYQWFEYADLDSAPIQGMIAAMANHRVAFDPTLVVVESIFFGDSPRIVENPALAEVPGRLLDSWQDFTMNVGWTEEDFRRARSQFHLALELTRRMHTGGVPIVAGSDLGNPWIVPGESMHRELELLVEAGIPAPEVLQIATLNGAEALGIHEDTGSIETGKRADIIILEKDPNEDISNTGRIRLVIANGRVVHRREAT